jgi:hypothetical protein
MKVRTVNSIEEIDSLVASVTLSVEKALLQLPQSGEGNEALKALWSMKVLPIGCDPLNTEIPLNIIEQINQTFTYIASARAAKVLLGIHPEFAPFTLNLGTSPGSDIESRKDGGLAAEVFAAVNIQSNRKLAKDVKKVGLTNAEHRYVFFMCPGIKAGRQQLLEGNNGIKIWSVGTVNE